MTKWTSGWRSVCLVVVCYVTIVVPVVSANSLQSPNYTFDESTLGAGGMIQSTSTNFQGSSSTGDLGVGNAASENFQLDAGSQTTNDPTLKFVMNNADANFGSFTPTSAMVTTSSFSVTNYTAFGYVVQIVGDPPTNGSHKIPGMAFTGPSQAGIEQFGINLVANTSPLSIGANPNNGQFGFGEVAPNYSTSNEFRYVSGETIALAPKSSGMTTYTLSYLVNVNSVTPGGQYKSNQTLIVTGTY